MAQQVASPKGSPPPHSGGEGTLIIACGALAHEITALRRANGWDHLEVRCLPAELHNRPERIPAAVRALVQSSRCHYRSIFVAYADCGTGGMLDALLLEHGVEHAARAAVRIGDEDRAVVAARGLHQRTHRGGYALGPVVQFGGQAAHLQVIPAIRAAQRGNLVRQRTARDDQQPRAVR